MSAFPFTALPAAQEEHGHPAPEKLGTVSFATSCKPELQQEFDRAVALLHSFAYESAEQAFQIVRRHDPQCAMAGWGSAMTHFHQLWDLPPSTADTAGKTQEISQAMKLEASERERGFIRALSLVFEDADTVPYRTRAGNYEAVMHELGAANNKDVETQAFYALALISNVSPSDTEHKRQKLAVGLLEPGERIQGSTRTHSWPAGTQQGAASAAHAH